MSLWVVLLLGCTGCAGSAPAAGDQISTTGTVTVRGNEPFTAVVLTTADRNSYILELTPDQRTALVTPSEQDVTGLLFLADWNGRPYAHIRVQNITRVTDY